jgi:hypothetical protein
MSSENVFIGKDDALENAEVKTTPPKRPGEGRFPGVKRLVVKWLRRRSQRRRLNWEKFNLMLARHPLPRPRIMVDLIRTGV